LTKQNKTNLSWTHGRVEISFPAAATPMMVETPQPLWHASSADRITSTLKDKETGLSNEKKKALHQSFPYGGGATWTYVARRVKRKVESTICELDEVILNTFAFG
jgi:hypothetical protein